MPASTSVPTNPVCYTPCQSSYTTPTGTFVPCSAEGLMLGCLAGTTCTNGSCVPTGQAVPSCGGDIDCPDYQACIQSHCYSNCEYDSDCKAGLACQRKVCRLPCSTAASSCADGQHCQSADGENGYCMPLLEPEGSPTPSTPGTFSVSQPSLAFTNIRTSALFTITNHAAQALEFSVRKVRHIEYTEQGPRYETATPLFWLAMGTEGDVVVRQEWTGVIDGEGGTMTIELAGAANETLPRWDGRLAVSTRGLSDQNVDLSYVERPDGRWAGKMYYFATFGEQNLQAWVDAGRTANAANVGNAFIQKWAAFKQADGHLSLDEWKAILTATETGSWDWLPTRERCTETFPYDQHAACYLYDTGLAEYAVDEDAAPIPSGLVEFPFAMNLRIPEGGTGARVEGRIESSGALQFPGNPSITLVFERPATECTRTFEGGCLVDVTEFSATSYVGGRYLTDASDSGCRKVGATGAFELARTPWLLPGFESFTSVDTDSGLRYRYECRDTTLPFGDPDNNKALNLSFANANPVPDANSRRRDLQLVDGALINSSTLFIIFKETYRSFLSADPADDFSAYGYLILERTTADLADDAFVGSQVPDGYATRPSALGTTCSAEALGIAGVGNVNAGNASLVANALIDGNVGSAGSGTYITASGGAGLYPHYLCVTSMPVDNTDPNDHTVSYVARSYFDHGPGLTVGDAGVGLDAGTCPGGSTLRYFLWNKQATDVEKLACQAAGSCFGVFEQQRRRDTNFIADPLWRCDAAHQTTGCDDRADPLSGKEFIVPQSGQPVSGVLPLNAAIADAFRYKTRFRSREGSGLGFAPDTCAAGIDALPYCYDPKQIEIIGQRLGCLTSLFNTYFAALGASQTKVRDTLTEAFAWYPLHSGTPSRDGFERLQAELLIALGDDAYSKSFASRFDLAGSAVYGFEGGLFEPDGLNLSGGAGYEMFTLYQATQYYQQALDRFYSLAPALWVSIKAPSANEHFVTLATVVAYFDRLVRASTQKARAASEIAKRYQSFNRPDLARRIIERAYASTYMESVILSHLTLRLVQIVSIADRPQISQSLRQASLGYRSALLDMQDVYDSITDTTGFFGYAPEYVPFPALDAGENNAFAKLFASARQKVAVAADKEDRALSADRSYETDSVSFQNELIRVQNTYEDQLSQICGTFVADDDRVYPAITKYAPLSAKTAAVGDPCGLVGNGQISDALASVELAGLDLRKARQAVEDVIGEIYIEQDRVQQQCGLIAALADYQWEKEGEINNLERAIRVTQGVLNTADRLLNSVQQASSLAKCSIIAGVAVGGDCAAAIGASIMWTAIVAANETAHQLGAVLIEAKQREIEDISKATKQWTTLQQCEVAQTDSTARIDSLLLSMKRLDLEILQAEKRLGLTVSQMVRQRQEAQRLQTEQSETEQMTIDLEAARNNPNVRIYKNDAIVAADRTFKTALREAYKATKVYEYYTSQSYDRLGDLFLVRMVSHGDISLESYLDRLEESFVTFEESYGNPDLRVAILSLRDDIFQIPRIGLNNTALTDSERIDAFRAKLNDVKLLDNRGYTTVAFATTLATLSPLTRNHKVQYLEAEISGYQVGDTLGRIYLAQTGTGVVRGVDDSKDYYVLPERTAVLNPFFNGQRVSAPEVYRNARLRDRPLVNSRWELVFNQRDELVNQDININALNDIRLYFYYSDFTAF